jgi:large subunit ribosomal protein L33
MPQDNLIKLQCTVCKRINYFSNRNKKTVKAKLELKKYCKWDRKHTLHREAKSK